MYLRNPLAKVFPAMVLLVLVLAPTQALAEE